MKGRVTEMKLRTAALCVYAFVILLLLGSFVYSVFHVTIWTVTSVFTGLYLGIPGICFLVFSWICLLLETRRFQKAEKPFAAKRQRLLLWACGILAFLGICILIFRTAIRQFSVNTEAVPVPVVEFLKEGAVGQNEELALQTTEIHQLSVSFGDKYAYTATADAALLQSEAQIWYTISYVENCPGILADKIWSAFCDNVAQTSLSAGGEPIAGQSHTRVARPKQSNGMEYIVSYRSAPTVLAEAPYATVAVRKDNSFIYVYVSTDMQEFPLEIKGEAVVQNALEYIGQGTILCPTYVPLKDAYNAMGQRTVPCPTARARCAIGIPMTRRTS